ncbi:MFS transporter [Nocardia sp. NPDC004151]|uniref:MFS transporter n=1 Tax=Nocardia sp. NPDC004151 TaxID=3364304 RepID=UPI00367E1087
MAWNLIGPLSSSYTKRLDLSPGRQSLLVATPVLVGSLGRIPVGVLTDKFGGRWMFTAICFISIIPVLLVGWSNSFAALLTPRLVDHLGRTQTHVLMAVALAVMGAIMWLFARNAPQWQPATEVRQSV